MQLKPVFNGQYFKVPGVSTLQRFYCIREANYNTWTCKFNNFSELQNFIIDSPNERHFDVLGTKIDSNLPLSSSENQYFRYAQPKWTVHWNFHLYLNDQTLSFLDFECDFSWLYFLNAMDFISQFSRLLLKWL